MTQTIRHFLFSVLCALPLSACFVSETSLIAEGAGVLPIDGGAYIGADDFSYASIIGDGYILDDPSQIQEPIRFQPLLTAGEKQYYLVEVPMGESDGGLFYGIARRVHNDDIGEMVIQIALLDCGDLPDEEHTDMRADGWQVSEEDSPVCAPPDLGAMTSLFREYLTVDILEDDDWWDEQSR